MAAFMRLAIPMSVAGLVLLLFYQPMTWMFTAWTSDPYYGHGFLIPLVSGGLVWLLRNKLSALPSQGSLWGLALTGLAVMLAILGISRQAFFAASLCIPLLGAGLTLYLKGWAALRLLLFPIFFLVLMIPLPFVDTVALQLQVWTSGISAELVRLLAIPAETWGASVTVPGASYTVGVACSGLNSMMALLAIGVLLAYLVEGLGWARVALVASLVPIAIFANVLRVSSILVLAYRFGSDAGLTYHDTVAGPLFWVLALGLLLLGSKILRCQLTRVVLS